MSPEDIIYLLVFIQTFNADGEKKMSYFRSYKVENVCTISLKMSKIIYYLWRMNFYVFEVSTILCIIYCLIRMNYIINYLKNDGVVEVVIENMCDKHFRTELKIKLFFYIIGKVSLKLIETKFNFIF